jgi:hypothetical protein
VKSHEVVLAIVATITVAGCNSTAPSAITAPSGTPEAVWVVAIPSGVPLACPDARVSPFRLRIDPAVRPSVWGERVDDGIRFDIIWPPGFRLDLTTAEPVLLDQDGIVFGRDGDLVTDAGGSLGDPAFICQRGGKRYRLT